MWRASINGVWSRKRRLLATCVAVVLGVAFLSATLMLGDTTRAGFADAFEEANAGTDAVVRGETELGSEQATQRALLDADLVDTIRDVDGVVAAEALVQGPAQIVGADGDALGGNGPPTLGAAWVTDPALNPYEIAEGRAPRNASEVVIDRGSADDGDLHVGDTTTVRTPAPVEVTVVGIVTFGSDDSLGGVTFTGFTLPAAQEYLSSQPDRVTGVVVAGEDGLGQRELVARIEPVLPDGIEAITGAELTTEERDEIESDFLGFFNTALVVFAGIALLVAMYSIFNTFSILVAQRTRESALLRAVGASRRQIVGSVAFEALVVGVVASAVGLAAGIGLAAGALALMDAAGFGLPQSALVVDAGSLGIAAAAGVIATLVASVAPAIKASQVAPVEALRDAAIDTTGASWRRAVTGLVVMAAGVGLTVAGAAGDGTLRQVALGALLAVAGMVLLGPVVARPAAAGIGAPIAALRGLPGSLARRNAMRSPRRTAGAAGALMVGVVVVTLFTVIAASLKSSIEDAVDESFGGDLVIETDFSAAGIDPDLADEIQTLPEVATSAGIAEGAVLLDGDEEDVTVTEPARLGAVFDLGVTEGSLEDVRDGGIAVSEDLADENGWRIGTTLPVAFADGASTEATVEAIYDEAGLMGDVVLPTATWAPHANRQTDVAVLVDLADGVSLAEGRAAVEVVAQRAAAPDVQDRDEFVASTAGEIDALLNVVYGLLALAIIIALMGIANVLSLSTHERRRELGLLRAVGQTRRQLRTMVRWESVVVALFGTVGGVGLGLFLGWGLFRALASQEGFGTFAAPVGQLVIVLAAGAIAGILAGIRPARRAARLQVLDAIASE
ncbi:MAG: ABC transporter permease [Acidimicrobiia bacterium]